jgi:hypothetical protein
VPALEAAKAAAAGKDVCIMGGADVKIARADIELTATAFAESDVAHN